MLAFVNDEFLLIEDFPFALALPVVLNEERGPASLSGDCIWLAAWWIIWNLLSFIIFALPALPFLAALGLKLFGLLGRLQ